MNFKHPWLFAAMLKTCCRHAAGRLHTLCHCIIIILIWMTIWNFLISETQLQVLEFIKHPVHAAGTMMGKIMNCKGELLFRSVNLLKLINGHLCCSSSKMDHIFAQYRFECILNFYALDFPKNTFYIIVLFSSKHRILEAFFLPTSIKHPQWDIAVKFLE